MTMPAYELDVRPMLKAGDEPFGTIMEAVARLEPGQSLKLLAPFKPVPLFGVLGARGFEPHAREIGNGDWEVLFSPVGSAPEEQETKKPYASLEWPEPRVELDNRHLDPPEPMVRVLEAVENSGAWRNHCGPPATRAAVSVRGVESPRTQLARRLRGRRFLSNCHPRGEETEADMSKHTAPEPVRELYRSLRTVIDPELGENIVDLGLIYEVAVHNGLARIVMTTTTPGCPAASRSEGRGPAARRDCARNSSRSMCGSPMSRRGVLK